MLNGDFTAINRFINRSTNKCNPFFKALRKNGTDFSWKKECEISFEGLKRYMALSPF